MEEFELDLDSDTMDLEFFIDDDDRLSVKIPWATGGHLSFTGVIEPDELKDYTGLTCWGYVQNHNSEFSKSYESIFTKSHDWERKDCKYTCKKCSAVSTGDVHNVFNSALDKVRDTCTQYKFEKYLVCLAISCRDDLKEGSGPITIHLDNLPHQFAELGDVYDMWKILKS